MRGKVIHAQNACRKEMTMLAPLDLEPLTLAARSLHRIEDARGTRVTCVAGAVWVTQERDPRDIILSPGQSMILDRPGTAIVFAFRDATITLGSASEVPAAGDGTRRPARVRNYGHRAWA
jgi:hypothetical protein